MPRGHPDGARPEALARQGDHSIHDGYVPLKSMDSTGFTPDEILDAVTTTENGWRVEEVYEVDDGE